MLEEKIDKLITVIEGLTHSIDRIWQADKQQEKKKTAAVKVTTEKPKAEKPKTEKPKTEKPKTEKPKTEKPSTVTHEQLHALCLDRVRMGGVKSNKKEQGRIKKLLKEYKAELIKDLKEDQLEPFKRALESI